MRLRWLTRLMTFSRIAAEGSRWFWVSRGFQILAWKAEASRNNVAQHKETS